MMNLKKYTQEAQKAIKELLKAAKLKSEQIVVIGCSTSEVIGEKIGTKSSLEVATALMDGLLPEINSDDLFMAVQCCEHLNRALVVEEKCAEKYNLEIVSVYPHQKAGGSFSAIAMERFTSPVVVESIQGHAGLDIGNTLIGMHLKRVVIPVRLEIKNIGRAHITAARTRPMLIGGERATYKSENKTCFM